MAFEEIFPGSGSPAKKVPLRVGMSKMRSAPARMVLLVQREVLSRLGAGAERYRLHLGRVDNKHQILIVRDDQGPFEANVAGQKSTVMRLRLPVVSQFPSCSIKPEPADFEIVRQPKVGLVVNLPAWAWNPEAKRRREQSP